MRDRDPLRVHDRGVEHRVGFGLIGNRRLEDRSQAAVFAQRFVRIGSARAYDRGGAVEDRVFELRRPRRRFLDSYTRERGHLHGRHAGHDQDDERRDPCDLFRFDAHASNSE